MTPYCNKITTVPSRYTVQLELGYRSFIFVEDNQLNETVDIKMILKLVLSFVSLFCEGAQQGSMDSPTGCFILKMACPMIKPSTIHKNNSREYVMATNIAMYPNARLIPNSERERKNRKIALDFQNLSFLFF